MWNNNFIEKENDRKGYREVISSEEWTKNNPSLLEEKRLKEKKFKENEDMVNLELFCSLLLNSNVKR